MKIEFENDIVTLKMKADEAGVIHGVICNTIIKIKAKPQTDPKAAADDEKTLAALRALDSRLRDVFFKYQHN